MRTNLEERLKASQLKELQLISAMVAKGEPLVEIDRRWESFVKKSKKELVALGTRPTPHRGPGQPINIDELVNWVLRQAYMESSQDLYFYANKVKFFNETKKMVRDYVEKLRQGKARTRHEIARVRHEIARTRHEIARTRETLENYIDFLEEELSSIGDDAQLANIDLQNILQKQSQTIGMLSTLSKMLHDTAMAVIRKIG